ncbi:MAG TPA: LuxR C-terminal-related transcriptional regulator [Candidatus Kapabacteria bacterium]|nr:LuxR C-terminal-related transcriptional regulator [Candidatus Kapabacteria bacterium]
MKRIFTSFFLFALIFTVSMSASANPAMIRTVESPLSRSIPARNSATTLGTLDQIPAPRRRRLKRHLSWEHAELSSNGLYTRNLEQIALHYPMLSPTEQRVCALVTARLPNWRAGELLGICEKTVENHLRNSRKKIGLPPGRRLAALLVSERFDVVPSLAPAKNRGALSAAL